ncbi:tRNA pseudouridine(55) synthase TruB [Thermodesulfobacteriota bacterium]
MIQRAATKDQLRPYKGPCDGIILIDKNKEETSFDVVKRLRKILGLKKVGHSGTLDPFATGLLLILLGQGTKLFPYLMKGEKRYLATMRLGIETDTLDPTGRVVDTRPLPELVPEEIEKNILKFVGDIEQVPPAFSAVNYKGSRAYKFAREGIKVDLKKRAVTIHSLEIISIDLPEITMEITCSGGTYVRSLAADMGKQLGSIAHLSSLRRLSSGPFQVKNALSSSQIDSASANRPLEDKVIALKDALPDMNEALIGTETAKKIRNGYRPRWEEVMDGAAFPEIYEGFVKLVNRNSLVAVMEVGHLSGDDKGWLKSIRVFN